MNPITTRIITRNLQSLYNESNMLWRRLRFVYGDTYHFCSITRRQRLKHAADRAFNRFLRRQKLLDLYLSHYKTNHTFLGDVFNSCGSISDGFFCTVCGSDRFKLLADVGRSSVQSAESLGQWSNLNPFFSITYQQVDWTL